LKVNISVESPNEKVPRGVNISGQKKLAWVPYERKMKRKQGTSRKRWAEERLQLFQ